MVYYILYFTFKKKKKIRDEFILNIKSGVTINDQYDNMTLKLPQTLNYSIKF